VYLSKSFCGTGLGAEKDGDLFLAIVNFRFKVFNNQGLGRYRYFGSLIPRLSSPNQNDDAADQNSDGSS
jgi:hypothetical protein